MDPVTLKRLFDPNYIRPDPPTPKIILESSSPTKACQSCNETKPIDQFYNTRYGNKRPSCNKCTNLYRKEKFRCEWNKVMSKESFYKNKRKTNHELSTVVS